MPAAFPIMHIRMDIPYCWSFLQASYPPLFETLRALISVAAAWHRAVIPPPLERWIFSKSKRPGDALLLGPGKPCSLSIIPN